MTRWYNTTFMGLMVAGEEEQTYAEKVLSYGPIAYWPLWDTAGAAATCLVNPLQNGTYAGPTLANGTAPDGSPCPLFDGVNDLVWAWTAAFDGVWDGDEFTVCSWMRVFNVGVWTDGTIRNMFNFSQVGWNSYTYILKTVVNNQLEWYRIGTTVADNVLQAGYNTTDWFHLAITCSVAADELKAYYNGVQVGLTQATLGAWGAALLTRASLASNGANDYWHGWQSHFVVFDRALTQPGILDLATA